jgi:hypothetical protein
VRFEDRSEFVQWGSFDFEAPIKRLVRRNLHRRSGLALRCDASLLPSIARLAVKKRVELLWHLETQFEYLGLSKAAGLSRAFYGAPIGAVEGPLRYSRTLIDGIRTPGSPKQLTMQFLEGLSVPRYLELKKLTNAQSASKHYVNQLLDAFHLWCAESCDAAVFLTTDYKLIGLAAKSPLKSQSLRLLTPRSLIRYLAMEGRLSAWDMLEAFGAFSYRFTRTFLEGPSDLHFFEDAA